MDEVKSVGNPKGGSLNLECNGIFTDQRKLYSWSTGHFVHGLGPKIIFGDNGAKIALKMDKM